MVTLGQTSCSTTSSTVIWLVYNTQLPAAPHRCCCVLLLVDSVSLGLFNFHYFLIVPSLRLQIQPNTQCYKLNFGKYLKFNQSSFGKKHDYYEKWRFWSDVTKIASTQADS